MTTFVYNPNTRGIKELRTGDELRNGLASMSGVDVQSVRVRSYAPGPRMPGARRRMPEFPYAPNLGNETDYRWDSARTNED